MTHLRVQLMFYRLSLYLILLEICTSKLSAMIICLRLYIGVVVAIVLPLCALVSTCSKAARCFNVFLIGSGAFASRSNQSVDGLLFGLSILEVRSGMHTTGLVRPRITLLNYMHNTGLVRPRITLLNTMHNTGVNVPYFRLSVLVPCFWLQGANSQTANS